MQLANRYSYSAKISHRFQFIIPRRWNGKHRPVCIHLAGTGDHVSVSNVKLIVTEKFNHQILSDLCCLYILSLALLEETHINGTAND